MTLTTTARERRAACAPYECPICERDHCRGEDEWSAIDPDEIHHAAHCCLWTQFDHAARVRIAERVEAGSDWADAIDGETK